MTGNSDIQRADEEEDINQNSEEDEDMVVKSPHGGGLREFISFLATVRGDLSNITAPPFILAPQSLVEFPSYWAERPAIFSAAAFEPDPAARMLCVLKLYLASLQRQYYVSRTVKEGLKKPLNPFLGEVFFAQWSDGESGKVTRVLSEQVSHHPPTLACLVVGEGSGVRAQAYSTQATSLSGTSVVIKQSGHAVLTVDKYDESFLLPLPDVRAKGLLSGVPYPELSGTYRLVSSSGLTAEIKFSGGGFWSGSRNMFEASIFRTDDSAQKALYTVNGSWSDTFTISDENGKTIEKFDISDPKNQPAPLTIQPVAEQDPWESRRAWAPVIDAVNSGDLSAVLEEKSKLENAQREMRKKEKAEGSSWETGFFSRRDIEKDENFQKLVAAAGDDFDATRFRGTNGCWRYDEERAKKWEDGHMNGRTPMGY